MILPNKTRSPESVLKRQRLEAARDRVVRAAQNWVHFEDDGTVPSLHRLTRFQVMLGNAVDRLDKLEGKRGTKVRR